MALYRSKLGPVGGGGEDGTREGGVVVDLDPLSAFVLMGGGGDKHDGAACNSGGTLPVSASGDSSRSKSEHNTLSSPSVSRRRSAGKMSGAAAPRPVADKKVPSFSKQVCFGVLSCGGCHYRIRIGDAPPGTYLVSSAAAMLRVLLLVSYLAPTLVYH